MPISPNIHDDKALTNLSIAYKNDRFIAERLAPPVRVKHDTDNYYVYTKDNLRVEETLWGNGAEANRADFELSTASYRLKRHALEGKVTDQDKANADPAIRLEMDMTEALTERIMLQRENDLATLVGTAANWANTTSLSATQAWSANTTLSNPILFVDSASSVIAQNSGKLPNVVALDHRTFMAAKEHVSLVDRIKYTSSDSVAEGLMAKLFNVDELLVGGAVQNTGEDGLAASMSFVWTDAAFVAYVERSPGLKKPSALYTLRQESFGGPMRVQKYREEKTESDIIRVSSKYQHLAPATDCAYLIVNTVQ